jgi:hypothetical protein
VAEWAKASSLVRVTGGRLVQLKRHARLLKHPLELWARMLEALPRLGQARFDLNGVNRALSL